MTKQLSPEANEAVDSLIEAFRLWLQQLIWFPGCLVTDVTDAAAGWIVCRITADSGGTVAGANQRCRWRQLFEISLNDIVDVLYDPRTMMFEIFKPGGSTGVSTHNLLGTIHFDTTTDAPTQGSLVGGNITPAWDEVVLGTARQLLQVDGGPTTFAWASFDWALVAAAAAADMVHDHSAAGEGGQLDWDVIWSDAIHNHSAAGEGGQLDWDVIWSDAIHSHSAAGEGGQLDWDVVWSDAIHNHSAAGEGGQSLLSLIDIRCNATVEENIDAFGNMAPDQIYVRIDTSLGAASDNLDTIVGGTEGDLLIIRPESGARTIVVRHGVGNIILPGGTNIWLDDITDHIMLIFDGTNWNYLGWLPGLASNNDILLTSLANYARGSIMRGEVADWGAHDAKTNHFLLVGDGTDIVSKAFDWGDVSAGAGADVVHDHTIATEGNTTKAEILAWIGW